MIEVPQLILLSFGLISLLWLLLLYSCSQVKYVPFNTNLNLSKKKSNFIIPKIWMYLLLMLLWLLFCEHPEDFSILFFLHYCPNCAFLTKFNRYIFKSLARSCFHISCVFILTDAISPITHLFSIFVFQIWCHAHCSNVPRWLHFILIMLANDIILNPGPPLQNQFLTSMNWNLNPLVKGVLNVLISLKPITPFLIIK